jgi:hypothetical protein
MKLKLLMLGICLVTNAGAQTRYYSSTPIIYGYRYPQNVPIVRYYKVSPVQYAAPPVQYMPQPVQPVQPVQQQLPMHQTIIINQYNTPNPATTPAQPVTVLPPVAKQEPVNSARDNYVKECQRYGIDKTRCENIWDDKLPFPESPIANAAPTVPVVPPVLVQPLPPLPPADSHVEPVEVPEKIHWKLTL